MYERLAQGLLSHERQRTLDPAQAGQVTAVQCVDVRMLHLKPHNDIIKNFSIVILKFDILIHILSVVSDHKFSIVKNKFDINSGAYKKR